MVIKDSQEQDETSARCALEKTKRYQQRSKKKIRCVSEFTLEGRTISLHSAAMEQTLDTTFYEKLLEEATRDLSTEEKDSIINERDRKGRTPLHYACLGGNYPCIDLLLKHGANLFEKSAKRRTPLHMASRSGCHNTVSTLLGHLDEEQLSWNKEFSDKHGLLPVHFAAQSGQWELIQLCSPSVECKAATKDGRQIIHLAVENGHLHIVRELLAERKKKSIGGFDKIAPDSSGHCLLHFAGYSGNLDLYKFLCEDNHLSFNRSISSQGYCPIFPAAISGNLDLVDYIIKKNPTVILEESFRRKNPLLLLARTGKSETLQKLLDSQANCSLTDCCDKQRNIFHYAVGSGSVDMVKKLLSLLPEGDSMMKGITMDGQSILHFVGVSKSGICGLPMYKWLLEESPVKGELLALLSLRDHRGISALHGICERGDTQSLVYLIETHRHHLDIIKDLEGESYLSSAAGNGYIDMVELLLERVPELIEYPSSSQSIIREITESSQREYYPLLEKLKRCLSLDVDYPTRSGVTALHIAANIGNSPGYRDLIKLNADLFRETEEGMNLLHCAAMGGEMKILEELVTRCNMNVKSVVTLGDQSTPLHYAARRMNLEMVKFLISKGADVNARNSNNVSVLHDACYNHDQICEKTQIGIVEYLLKNGAFSSLRVKGMCRGDGKYLTPYGVASNQEVIELLVKYDPSYMRDYSNIPFSILEPFLIQSTFCGKGNFGTVHKGKIHGTDVAIKKQEGTIEDEHLFRMEIGVMAKICHPNICMLMGACIKDTAYLIVMEYIPQTLEEMLPRLTIPQILQFATDICRGMAWLHGQEPAILHSDLKCDNILIDNGRAKITDFGLARMFDSSSKKSFSQDMNQIHIDTAAPERDESGKCIFSKEFDVFSYGCLLYRMLWKGEKHYQKNGENNKSPGVHQKLEDILFDRCCGQFANTRSSFCEILKLLEDGSDSSDDPATNDTCSPGGDYYVDETPTQDDNDTCNPGGDYVDDVGSLE